MTNGFIKKKLESARTLGERLKKAKEEAKVTLEEISQATKIPKDYLAYLEEGQYDLLPADVYVRGYLKQYISCLGLDYDEMLKLYKRERGIQEHIKKDKQPNIEKPRVNFIITPRIIRIGGIAILVLGLFFYLWMQMTSLAAPPELQILEPAGDTTIKKDVVVIKGKTEPEVELFINDQPVSIDGQGNFEESIGLTLGMNTLKIVARSKVGKETVIIRKILVESSQEE